MALCKLALLLVGLLHAVTGRSTDDIGTLLPEVEAGIIPSVSNINESADYTFKLYTSTTIPVGGTITITFPYEYISGLGISTPSCTGGTCTVSGYDVVITTATEINLNGLLTLVVSGVKNPSKTGGTGPFKIVTKLGTNVLDYNSAFGVIGLSSGITLMTSTSALLMSGGNSATSQNTYYDFRFQT
jgi:hypothetical protein